MVEAYSVYWRQELWWSAAADLEAVLAGPPGNLITRPQQASSQSQLANTGTLF